MHVNTFHLGLEPHSCPICNAKFGHKHLLTRHSRIHSRIPETQPSPSVQPPSSTPAENIAAGITGFAYNLYTESTGRNLDCPIEGCFYKFQKSYDVYRHVVASHGDSLGGNRFEYVSDDEGDGFDEEISCM